MNRLIAFFLEEQQLRWKVYLTSATVAFVYALVNLFVVNRNEERVSLETLVVLLVSITVSIAIYVTRHEPIGKVERTFRFNWWLCVAATAATAIVLALYQNRPRLQALVVDHKLRSFISFFSTVQAANLPDEEIEERYQKLDSILARSASGQVPVDPSILQKAQYSIISSLKTRPVSNQTKQIGWTTAIDLELFAYARKAETGEINRVTPRQIANAGGYLINSPLVFDKGDVYIQGDHSWIFLGVGGGQIIIDGVTVVFDKIDFEASTPGQPAIELGNDRSGALVRDSIMKNVTQYLERITWVDVRFENSRTLYKEGAPLRLRNVSFVDCDLSHLQMPFGGPIASELVKRIEDAHGQPIPFIYEPPQ
jgi:hypothetical protein